MGTLEDAMKEIEKLFIGKDIGEDEVYPGKIWFYKEPRLGRDMTHSTDWKLICSQVDPLVK